MEEVRADCIDRAVAIPPKVIPAVKWGTDHFSCRRCGYGLPDSDRKRRFLYVNNSQELEAHWNYCPNCGGRILHASFAGCCGWTKESADRKYEEICEGLMRIDLREDGNEEF